MSVVVAAERSENSSTENRVQVARSMSVWSSGKSDTEHNVSVIL